MRPSCQAVVAGLPLVSPHSGASLDGLPTAASSHSNPGLACNIAAFFSLPSLRSRRSGRMSTHTCLVTRLRSAWKTRECSKTCFRSSSGTKIRKRPRSTTSCPGLFPLYKLGPLCRFEAKHGGPGTSAPVHGHNKTEDLLGDSPVGLLLFAGSAGLDSRDRDGCGVFVSKERGFYLCRPCHRVL